MVVGRHAPPFALSDSPPPLERGFELAVIVYMVVNEMEVESTDDRGYLEVGHT